MKNSKFPYMKSVFTIFSCALVAISIHACSSPTTSAVAEDEEVYNSNGTKSSSSYQTDVKESSSSIESSSSEKIDSSSSHQLDEKQSSSSAISSSSSKVAPGSSSAEKPSSSTASVYDAVEENGKYTSKDSVAAYVCKFDKLPQNYVGKSEGKKLYESSTGNAFSKWNFNPWETLGVMIGGDNFDNFASDPDYYHSTLPEGNYREADVDYGNATSRGTKRLVYQSGCIIYYTADHYESFSRINF